MSDLERVIGKLEQFQESAEKRFDKIETKLDGLQQWKWRVAGATGLLSVLAMGVVELFHLIK